MFMKQFSPSSSVVFSKQILSVQACNSGKKDLTYKGVSVSIAPLMMCYLHCLCKSLFIRCYEGFSDHDYFS